ncbi:aminobenzoyl-glutamate transport protein [Saccharopolyspora kobensis]|uniref:Aminobenzoyl-glutamate transport protein n=1 Tax=Saccharopolyspora kobensis TaxID=146035 RepID=A0A1H5W4U5_9PSEU|nr:AbgT family transporter [Saccharopolyspora kobensis]SEF94529.1 aminobenzoyl-glutamate transport protein [Saccharopolyspora kobensis]SFD72410.1 aminobenzoyl-glutamate transport protein [Saccharopolyspora kobensis]
MRGAAQTPPRSTRALIRVLAGIERAGNVLPHPFWLFGILSAVLAVLSWGLHALGATAINPSDGGTVAVRDLISADGIRTAVSGVVENFVTFPPLGTALVTMIGVAVADKAGLLTTMLRAAVIRVPRRWVTFALAFTGMIAHVASDAAYIVLIPLGAIVFRAVGRSPVLGIVVALVAISAGTDASPLITPTDVILSGLNTAAAGTLDPAYVVSPVANYFFSAVSSVVLSAVITLVVEGFLAKRVEAGADDEVELDESALELTPDQRRGLRNAGIAALGYLAVLVLVTIPGGSPLRGEDGSLLDSPLLSGIAIVLALLFTIAGAAYGIAVGAIRRSRDLPDLMTQGLRDIAPILVLFFAVSQFLAFFKWTRIGEVTAIHGAALLKSLGAHSLLIFLGILVLVSLINLVVTSGSAQWALVAPVFVPMLMLLDIPPETTQALYRIADSCTNVITPMSPYFVMALGFIQRYRRDAGIGTLAAMTIPLALTMLLVWTLLFFAWWALGIPLGPGAPVR